MARPILLIRQVVAKRIGLAHGSPSTARQAITGTSSLCLSRHGSSSAQPHAHPRNVLNLDLELPSPPQRSAPSAHLKDNEYASTYQVSEEDLPPEEKQYKRISMEKSRLVFIPDGILLHRGDANDAISHQRLRDNCRCPKCIDPSTRQKLRSSGSAASIKLTKGFEGYDGTGQKGVHFNWSDGHSSFYGEDDLRDMVTFNESKTNINHHFKRRFWDQEILLQSPNLRMAYDEVQSKDGLLAMLRQAQVYGLVVVSGVPAERTSDKDCELRAFMSRIGEIRNTFYGETWDVKSMVNSKNVAYTSQDLGFHMDLLYFSSPPRWQALHCLRNRVEGGSSYFADAFFAGRHIQHTDPATTAALARHPLDFEYDNDGHYLRHRHFVMNQLDSLRAHINWSPPFQGPVRKVAAKGLPTRQSLKIEKDFYDALAKFEASLHRPGVQYEFKMEEGDLVFFDNRRVLHARREFGPGERWLKGCYLDGEVVWDKLVTMQP